MTAVAIMLFEIIPMTTIPAINAIIKQQEEHIIYPIITKTKTEDEHVITIPSYNSFTSLLSNRKSNTFKNEQQTAAKDEKLLHLTFRTRENVIRILKKEANSKGIPLSILLNNILKSYFVQMNIERPDFILCSKDFFRRIFGKIDEKSLEDYGAELARAIVSEYTSSFFPDIDAYTIVQFLEMWFKRFQSFQHRIDEKNNRHTFSLNHDVNMNFSIVLRVILESLVEPIIKNKLAFGELTSSCITFSFNV
jgi:hypothetical protein